MKQSKNGLSRELYFPTIVYQSQHEEAEELNTKLLELIYAEREVDEEGIQKSNFRKLGGWHSKTDLHKSAKYRQLTDHINSVTKEISSDLGYDTTQILKIGTMWSIINAPGSSNRAHIHPGAYWSGVYYVQAPKDSGKIEFTDPRTEHLMNQPRFIPGKSRPKPCWTKVQFTPTAGKMLIFPSWLYHSVLPNLTEETGNDAHRVIISFNILQQKS